MSFTSKSNSICSKAFQFFIVFILIFTVFVPLFPRSVSVDWDSPNHIFLHSFWLVTGLPKVLAHIFLCWDCNFSISHFATSTPLGVPLALTLTSWQPLQRVPVTVWEKNKSNKPADCCSEKPGLDKREIDGHRGTIAVELLVSIEICSFAF